YLRAQYFRSQQQDPPFFAELARFILKDKEYETNFLAQLASPLDRFFQARGARVEKRWRTGTSWFTRLDFLDLPSLAAKLDGHADSDPLSKWIFDQLAPETQELVRSRRDANRLRKLLARDLNALLERELKQKQQLARRERAKQSLEGKILESQGEERL